MAENTDTLTVEARRIILDAEVAKQVTLGWRVTSRTDTTAQLVKDKGPDGCITIFLLLFFIVPGILYMILYKGSENLYLEVDEQGNIKRTGQG